MRSKWCKYVLSLAMMSCGVYAGGMLQGVFAQEIAQTEEMPKNEMNDLKWQLKQMEEAVLRQQEQIQALKNRIENISTETASAEAKKEEASHVIRTQIKNAYEDYPSTEETQKAMELGMPDVASIYTPTGDIEGRFYAFSIMTPDEKFSLNVGARLQTRYTFKDKDEDAVPPGRDVQDINLSRARLLFNGNIYSKWLRYYAELNGDNFKVQMEEMNIYWAPLHDNTVIGKVGMFKTPFNRERLSTAKLLFMDRSIANNTFNQGIDFGMDIYGKPFDGYMEYHVAVVQGAGRDLDPNAPNAKRGFTSIRDNPNNNNSLLYMLNLRYNPFGWYDYYDETDLLYSNKLKATIGASVAFNGVGTPDNNPVSNTKDNIAGVVDFGLKYKGLSWNNEFYAKTGKDILTDNSVSADGFFTEVGYFVLPKRLELAARYSVVDPNIDISHNLLSEYLAGVNYYFHGHRSKIQANVGRFITEDKNQDITENRVQLMYQIYF